MGSSSGKVELDALRATISELQTEVQSLRREVSTLKSGGEVKAAPPIVYQYSTGRGFGGWQ